METHGECWYARKCKIEKSQSLAIDEFEDRRALPKRMSRKDAGKYYNKKLFGYWSKGSDKKIVLTESQIVSMLMFCNIDIYKNLRK